MNAARTQICGESMEGLSLGTVLSQRLGPPPEAQPDVEHSAEEALTQQDLNKLRRPDSRSRQLNQGLAGTLPSMNDRKGSWRK